METPSSPAIRFIVVVVDAMCLAFSRARPTGEAGRGMALALKLIDFNGKA
jgi:hypothetical protein